MTTPNPPDKAGAAAPSPALLDHGTILSIMSGIMLAMFLSALEQTIVSPALPTIGRSLGDVETLSWVVSAYLLTYTAATPLFGKLSDIYGRRLMLLTSLAIFIVGSAACALAPNMPALIVARALQGIGGGGILPIAHTVIGDMVAPRERPRYMAYTSVMFMVASVLGPLLGGTADAAKAIDRANDPAGVWLTQSGDARIKVHRCGAALCGRVVWLKEPTDKATGKPQLDDKNADPAQRTRPVMGISLSSIFVACPLLLWLRVSKQDLLPKAKDDAELARRP